MKYWSRNQVVLPGNRQAGLSFATKAEFQLSYKINIMYYSVPYYSYHINAYKINIVLGQNIPYAGRFGEGSLTFCLTNCRTRKGYSNISRCWKQKWTKLEIVRERNWPSLLSRVMRPWKPSSSKRKRYELSVVKVIIIIMHLVK